MNTAELKLDLINHITNIKDKVRLKELLQQLKFQADESLYITNENEKTAISEARYQIENGDILANDSVQEEIKEWLKK
ncbi:hypothetical protein [Epilithonimonas xixisoli]|uniref:Addiction module component n=1 Tax=Epilithonimonas xixisoli TaxID=1476462 RepID=A0A4R8IJA2_9FLAO|nr:hypothetical protein [Epilithonimonas xixisoli]TDX86699.1 hypothetical protein B0I22_0845 [Epilithonimonas xixisoli]